MTHFWHPRTGTTAFLPHLAAATDLLVIDPVTQQDPQPNPEFAINGDSRAWNSGDVRRGLRPSSETQRRAGSSYVRA